MIILKKVQKESRRRVELEGGERTDLKLFCRFRRPLENIGFWPQKALKQDKWPANQTELTKTGALSDFLKSNIRAVAIDRLIADARNFKFDVAPTPWSIVASSPG